MNPGLAVDDDLVINTSSNALYDTEQNILDNVLRTLLIEKASDKFYYKNEDGTYSLVKNETNFVYSLKWENKIYHFLTYVDAKNYLNEILKLEAMKVSL